MLLYRIHHENPAGARATDGRDAGYVQRIIEGDEREGCYKAFWGTNRTQRTNEIWAEMWEGGCHYYVNGKRQIGVYPLGSSERR